MTFCAESKAFGLRVGPDLTLVAEAKTSLILVMALGTLGAVERGEFIREGAGRTSLARSGSGELVVPTLLTWLAKGFAGSILVVGWQTRRAHRALRDVGLCTWLTVETDGGSFVAHVRAAFAGDTKAFPRVPLVPALLAIRAIPRAIDGRVRAWGAWGALGLPRGPVELAYQAVVTKRGAHRRHYLTLRAIHTRRGFLDIGIRSWKTPGA